MPAVTTVSLHWVALLCALLTVYSSIFEYSVRSIHNPDESIPLSIFRGKKAYLIVNLASN
jgi:hypothetical protein